ncbi:MAG: NAD(P)-dependent oxidoreductase [Armatimonadota bacterium]|nr:NAD(P)-dependent oxidoreductase [bacterium]
MKHAFITGAAGFIGGYAVREFVEQGWHVFALVHRKTSAVLDELAASGSVTIVQGDLSDFAELERDLREQLESRGVMLDAIVHCAGRASDVGRRDEFRRTNFESVQNLSGIVEHLDVGQFVFVSTTDVYGLRNFNGESEDELPLQDNIRNPYPEFKIAAEEWILKTLPPERYSIIRPTAVWGVGDPTLTPRIVSFLKSSPWIIHFGKWQGSNRWPLAHVRNVATAIYLAATLQEAAGSAVNVLDSEITTIEEFYRIVASVYLPEKRLRSVTLPMWIGKAFGTVVSSISNTLNLDHPFTDPSLYALYSVASNLDFSNERFLHLLKRGNRRIVSRDEGVDELRSKSS